MPQLTNIQCEIRGKYNPGLQKTIYRADIVDKDEPVRQVILQSLNSGQNFTAYDTVTEDLIIFSVDGKKRLDELENGDIISIKGCIPKPQA